jgi:D-alanyl-D-alanine carboxypeptidase
VDNYTTVDIDILNTSCYTIPQSHYKKEVIIFMRVILRSIYLLCLGFTFILSSHSVFAAQKNQNVKKPQDIKEEKLVEDIDIIRYPGSTAMALKARQAIVMDYSDGKILLEKNAHEQMAPSSMTKIMTS